MKPIAMPNSSTTAIDGQMFQSARVVSRPSSRPEEPIMTPAERSNSPPIMSSATGTATIPYCADWSIHWLQMAKSDSQPTLRAVQANRKKTATAPQKAPMSGRATRRATMLTPRESLVGGPGGGCGLGHRGPCRGVGGNDATHPWSGC